HPELFSPSSHPASVEVGLEQQSFTTYEGAGSTEVCVRIERGGFPTTQPFSLLVSTQDASATAPSDYLALSDVIIGPFTASNTVQCFSVTIVRDAVCEGEVDEEGYPRPEVFSAIVRSEEGSSVEVRGSSSVATITIEEAAECIPVVVGFDQVSYTARETDEPLGVVVNVSSPVVLRRNVTITVQTVPGTATPNVDYLASSLTVQLSNNQRTLPLSLLIADDGICDSSPRETLQIRLSSSDPNVTLSPGVASVTILDSPPCVPGTVRFQQTSFVSSEEVGWAVVCASFSSPPSSSSSSFSLTLSTYDITARAGEDYVSVSRDLSFGPNVTQQCQLLLLVQDSRCEATMTESFGLKLTSTENGRTAIQDSASVVIYDSPECITVRTGFEEVVYALGESSGSVVVCAEILSPAVAEREFFLLLSSSNRDAVAGEDYTGLQDVPLGPFSLSQRRNCLSVSVTDDGICEEPEESFVLSLTTDDEFIDISRDSVTVYIEDGLEIECVQVSCGFEGSTSYIVQETSGEFELCVGVYPALRFNFTVNLTTVDGSATSGSDYAPVSEMLEFAPGVQRHCVSITILNDQES
ncbi:FRAS1-related extracellular matrix protein 2, partial [Geodia barretti]